MADQYPGKEIEEVTEEYAGPWPHEGMPYLSDEAAAIQKEFNTNPYFQNLQDPNVGSFLLKKIEEGIHIGKHTRQILLQDWEKVPRMILVKL